LVSRGSTSTTIINERKADQSWFGSAHRPNCSVAVLLFGFACNSPTISGNAERDVNVDAIPTLRAN